MSASGMASEADHCFEALYLNSSDPMAGHKPFMDGNQWLIGGEIRQYNGKMCDVKSPVLMAREAATHDNHNHHNATQTIIGRYPMFNAKEALETLDAAVSAWNHGRGQWPSSSVKFRVECVEKFMIQLKSMRNEIVDLLMWEICKVRADAEKEVDRTIKYIQDTLQALKNLENSNSTFTHDGGIFAQIRRAPIGVVLCLGPFNYPFNETYTTLIPALIMGNCIVSKLPRVGVLCHFPTFKLFQSCFPPGVINIVSGSGRETLPPIMASGRIDVFAFIGTSTAADDLLKHHPKPHRLRVCLGLEAKNPAIVLPDADLDNAIKECVLGSLSYNGQRCTAIKIIFVHKRIEEEFLKRFTAAVDSLKMGLPWEDGVNITPLPEENKPGYLQELIVDAVAKGAKIINPKLGGKRDRTFVGPTLLYPVNKNMRVYNEEQFGPVVPIRSFEQIEEVYEYLDESPYGQQAAIFGKDPATLSKLFDVLVNSVARVNVNCQCQRGPDSFPFTGRKDSAYGTLSITDALRVFSIRTLVAAKESACNHEIATNIVDAKSSTFLRMDYLF